MVSHNKFHFYYYVLISNEFSLTCINTILQISDIKVSISFKNQAWSIHYMVLVNRLIIALRK